eukprot:2044926-Prymnesium_polylepis.1
MTVTGTGSSGTGATRGSPASARRPSRSSLGRASSQAVALATARLRLGLNQLMLSGGGGLTAFPVDEEMEEWMASVPLPRGGPLGESTLSLRLTFELSK